MTRNFDAVYSYNAAESYGLAIALLGDRLAAGRASQAAWPTDDPPLSRAQRRELQQLLTARGYDVGEPDGKIGQKTRDAIKDIERQHRHRTARPARRQGAAGAAKAPLRPHGRAGSSATGSPFEKAFGYSRAVVPGPVRFRRRNHRLRLCHHDDAGRAWRSRRGIAGAPSQRRSARPGASLADIVRATYYVTDAADAEPVLRDLRRGPGRDPARRARC